MRSYRKELWFHVPTRRAFINITQDVEACLQESGIAEGLVLVNAMHITCYRTMILSPLAGTIEMSSHEDTG